MNRIRNDEWQNDESLRNELSRLIQEGFKHTEILSYMKRDFSEYAWSGRTLKRRINYFELRRCDNESTFEEATEAISEELHGPGKLLGYRAMHQKLRKVIVIFCKTSASRA